MICFATLRFKEQKLFHDFLDLDELTFSHCMEKLGKEIFVVALRGVVVDLSALRDRGPGFKTQSRPLTFMKADTTLESYTLWDSHCANEFLGIPS